MGDQSLQITTNPRLLTILLQLVFFFFPNIKYWEENNIASKIKKVVKNKFFWLYKFMGEQCQKITICQPLLAELMFKTLTRYKEKEIVDADTA